MFGAVKYEKIIFQAAHRGTGKGLRSHGRPNRRVHQMGGGERMARGGFYRNCHRVGASCSVHRLFPLFFLKVKRPRGRFFCNPLSAFISAAHENVTWIFLSVHCRDLPVNGTMIIKKAPPSWQRLKNRAKGGEGGEALAREVVRLCEEEKGDFTFSYELDGTIENKIEAVVKKVYGGDGITVMPAAKKQIEQLTKLGFDKCPVCIAKTQYSFSDDPTKLGAPENFTVTVKNVKVSAGAGFIVVLTGDILTMPGLPKSPAAERIDVDAEGKITGLF